MTANVTRTWSGGPGEQGYGYCRALRSAGLVFVSGCTAAGDPAVLDAGDAAAQFEVAARTALAALADLGAGVADVVRTRIYLVDRADADAVGAAHQRVFGSHPPAATMVVVAGLIDTRMRVELEVEAAS